MEIKFVLDTKKASKALAAVAANHGHCKVSESTDQPQTAHRLEQITIKS
jgi:hypothetical protein